MVNHINIFSNQILNGINGVEAYNEEVHENGEEEFADYPYEDEL